MTSNHIFYIPIIFFLGIFVGVILAGFTSRSSASPNKENKTTKIKGRTLAAAFGVFAIVFILTHMLPFPGGVKSLHASLGHQPIFDMQSSFAAEEVYKRVENFGDSGRASYKAFTFTSDLIFPLSFFFFLFVLAKFVGERTTLSMSYRHLLTSASFIWLASDLIENAIVYNILSTYPDKNVFLMTMLAPVTTSKFILLLVSIILPSIAFVGFRKNEMN